MAVHRIRVWKDGSRPPQSDWRVSAIDENGQTVQVDESDFPTIAAAKARAEQLWPGVTIDAPLSGSRKD